MQANNTVFSTKLDFNNLVYFLWTHLQDRPRASLPDCLCPCTAPRILAGAAVTALTGFLLTAAFLLAFRFLISPFRVLSCSNTNRPTGFHTPNCPRSAVTGLSFRLPSSAFRHLSPPPFPAPRASPSGRKDLGDMPRAGRRSASHLEEMLHFSPLTQKEIWFSESLFLALRVPKGRRRRRRGLQPLTVA